MNGIVAAALPVFGLLACLFLGFILLSSESRSGERIGYLFFGVGVAWLIASGTVLWPQVSHAKQAPAAQVATQTQAVARKPAAPAQYAWRGYAPRPQPYGYGQPYAQPQFQGYAYAYARPAYYGPYYR